MADGERQEPMESRSVVSADARAAGPWTMRLVVGDTRWQTASGGLDEVAACGGR